MKFICAWANISYARRKNTTRNRFERNNGTVFLDFKNVWIKKKLHLGEDKDVINMKQICREARLIRKKSRESVVNIL